MDVMMLPVGWNRAKPKLLFLDDRSKRFEEALRKYAANFDVTFAPNVKECLRALSRQEWDEFHMDFDLQGVDFQDPDSPETGMEVIRYIEKCGGWPEGYKPPIVKVHSTNLFAAHLMIMRLHRIGMVAFYEPFTYEKRQTMKYDAAGIPVP